jgi:hypothetical protein
MVSQLRRVKYEGLKITAARILITASLDSSAAVKYFISSTLSRNYVWEYKATCIVSSAGGPAAARDAQVRNSRRKEE